MTEIDEVEITVGAVKQALNLELEDFLANMKFEVEPNSPFEKEMRTIGMTFATDSLKLFVKNICSLLNTAANQALQTAAKQDLEEDLSDG